LEDCDKYCTLCIDEMSLKAYLNYDSKTDEVIGLEDLGNEKRVKPACNAIVGMLRGIRNSWKQPLFFNLVYTQCLFIKIKNMIIECIRKVKEIGFHIVCVAVVSDMGSNFVQLTKSLEVSTENSSFEIDGETYFYIFDVPHLLKATRNNLMNNVFSMNDKLTSWKHVEAIYKIGKTMRNQPAPKLTENHIRPNNFARMKVKFATQVISMTVATSIELMVSLKALQEDALVTSDFICNFDYLFDMCNSSTVISSKKHKKAFTGSDFQLNFLNKMMTMISTLKVYKQLNDGLKDVTNSLSFINGWLITIRSIQEIWKKLKNVGFDFLLTRRLNQDCLENFFDAFRSLNGNALNPTPLQFLNSFKKLFFIHYSNLGNTGNCLDDYNTILTNFSNIESVIIPTISFFDNQNESKFLQKVLFNDIQETEISKITEENVFIFVCGYLLKKCLKYIIVIFILNLELYSIETQFIYITEPTVAHKIIFSIICVWLQTNLLFM